MAIPVILLGSHGLLGTAFRQALAEHGNFTVREFGRGELNLTNPAGFERALENEDFSVLINAAAYTAVDDCEIQGELAYLVNGQAPGSLARICARRGARMLQFSTDFVFDGLKAEPYVETDAPHPISVYGKSKLLGEELVQAASADHAIFRLSWLFGPGRPSFPEWVISKAQRSPRLEVVSDKYATPTYSVDAAQALLPWISDRTLPGGLWHYCQPPSCAWNVYAQTVLDAATAQGVPLETHHVSPIAIAQLPGLVARRPPQSALSVAKLTAATGHHPRPWQEAIAEYIAQQYPATQS
jgi:dTDP-4-dehydrorhamnose reductase